MKRNAHTVLTGNTILNGPGGRLAQNAKAPGISIEGLKKHYSLIPILLILGYAVVLPTLYCIRLATQATDVIINKKNKAPWDDYTSKAFKFVNISGKEHIPSPRPKFE